MGLGIALDLGTSGYRTHLVDLDREGKILSTAISMRHPLPGANIMDHLHFWIENGADVGHRIIVETVDRLIRLHNVDPSEITRMSICGNPIQLSMFENIEIRDLAYAGQSKLDRLGITRPSRRGHVKTAGDLDLKTIDSEVEVVIPPAIRHEIGADALAVIMKSGLLDNKDVSMVTDYGTNAEMGLFYDGELYSGSAAAGPAIEGQHISDGMLAAPHALSDFALNSDGRWTNFVLDDEFNALPSSYVNVISGDLHKNDYIDAIGITGTGVVAAVAMGLESGVIKLPHIDTPDSKIHFQNNIEFTERDLRESGKAMGAIRAGHRTLIHEVGIEDIDVHTMYMAGASGTYVDPFKAQIVGMIPRQLEKVVRVGNTSLMMAYDLLCKPEMLDEMQEVADSIASKHIMFATSKTFEDLYVNELAYWIEGMSEDLYNMILEAAGLNPLPPLIRPKENIMMVKRDIPVLGERGLMTLFDVGVYLVGHFQGCDGCMKCKKKCPEHAIEIKKVGENQFMQRVATDRCLGTACKQCEMVCPQKAWVFSQLKITERDD